MVQEIVELRDAVHNRAIMDLAEIATDPTVSHDGKLRCASCATDFENVIDAVLNEAWIPKTIPQITAGILRMNQNLRKMRSGIDAALDRVLDDARPDLLFRVWMAMNFERLLEAQREILFATTLKIMPESGWIN